MAFNYARIRDIIGKSVDQFAQTAYLQQPATQGDASNYREPTGDLPAPIAIRVVDQKNVVVESGSDEGNVPMLERHIIILNDGGIVPEPTRKDKIYLGSSLNDDGTLSGGEDLSISRVMDANPAGTSMVYTCVIEE